MFVFTIAREESITSLSRLPKCPHSSPSYQRSDGTFRLRLFLTPLTSSPGRSHYPSLLPHASLLPSLSPFLPVSSSLSVCLSPACPASLSSFSLAFCSPACCQFVLLSPTTLSSSFSLLASCPCCIHDASRLPLTRFSLLPSPVSCLPFCLYFLHPFLSSVCLSVSCIPACLSSCISSCVPSVCLSASPCLPLPAVPDGRGVVRGREGRGACGCLCAVTQPWTFFLVCARAFLLSVLPTPSPLPHSLLLSFLPLVTFQRLFFPLSLLTLFSALFFRPHPSFLYLFSFSLLLSRLPFSPLIVCRLINEKTHEVES